MDPDDLTADLARRAAQSAGYRHQSILNTREIPPRHLQVDAPAPIPVLVRLEWAADGEAWQDGRAVGWCVRRGHLPIVLVELRHEPRCTTACIWVAAADIRRADSSPEA